MDLFPLAVVGFACAFVVGWALVGLLALGLQAVGLRSVRRGERRFAWAGLALFAVGALAFLYGWKLEARWLEVTHQVVETPALPAGRRVRIAHLTDLHLPVAPELLAELPRRVNAEQPDLLLVTGDLLNEETAVEDLRTLLARLEAPFGRYVTLGNCDDGVDWPEIDPSGSLARELRGDPVELSALGVTLCGASYVGGASLPPCLERSRGARVVAFHTPDRIEELAPLGPALYLAGHTHGGQVRLPWYGAVVTFSFFGKKYEVGRHAVGGTTLYVNRGLGTEGGLAPKVRFLCRPEVAIIDLVGAQSSAGVSPAAARGDAIRP